MTIVLLLAALLSPAHAHEDLQTQLALADNVVVASPDEVAGWLRRAELFRQAKLFEYALRDLEEAERIEPLGRDLWFARAKVYRDRNDWAQARRSLDRWQGLGDPDVDSWALRAQIDLGAGRPADALDDLDAAVAIAPSTQLVMQRAELAERLGQPDRAASGFSETIDALHGAVSVRMAWIALESRRGGYDAALDQADALLAATPEHPDYLLLRGDLHAAKGDAASARADRERAVAVLDKRISKRPTAQLVRSRERALSALGTEGTR